MTWRTDKKILGVIPARGGSKGVPRKNLRHFAGKRLLEWAIEAASRCHVLSHFVVSSEDAEILSLARTFGERHALVRPPALATDEASGIDVALHAADARPGYDWVVLLQPTSPQRSAQDIDESLAETFRRDAPACVSVTAAAEHPFQMYFVDRAGTLRPCLPEAPLESRRQDLPPVYKLNGAIYAAEITFLRSRRTFLTPQTYAYPMPFERSRDIDSEADLVAEGN